jgi:hypothetical protein
VSTTDGDASSRLDEALAGVFAKAGEAATAEAAAGSDVDDATDHDQPYTLPEIVPATVDAPSDDVEPAATPPAAAATTHASVGGVAPTLAPTFTPTLSPAANPASQPPATVPATSWTDHMTNVPVGGQSAQLRAPGRRPRVRRVTRVLRHVDPWSTFKVALLFSVVAYLVSLTAGVLLWRVADSTGTLDNVERWFTQFGWETFELKGGEIFHNAWIIGLFGAVALTGGLVLLATLFNLVSDVVGGVRLTVLEEEVVERTVSSTRRYVVRRPPSATAEVDWDVDDVDPSEPTVPVRRTVVTTEPAASSADWSIDDDDDDDADDDNGTGDGPGGGPVAGQPS